MNTGIFAVYMVAIQGIRIEKSEKVNFVYTLQIYRKYYIGAADEKILQTVSIH